MVGNYEIGEYYNSDKGKGAEPIFGIRTIGASRWVDASIPDPIKAIQTDIWGGAGHIEITAPGTGRGDRNNPTFEGFDVEQREALRELVKINKVTLTTHATPNVQLSGFDNRQGFNDNMRRRNIDEVRKAIDFASDVTSGGSVVVHTGEFPRPLFVEGKYGYKDSKYQFQFYPEEEKDAQYYLTDKETGDIISSVKANQVIFEPIHVKDKNGNEVILRDENGNPAYDDVIREDLEQIHKKKFEDLPEELKAEAYIKEFEKDDQGNIKTERISFIEFKHRGLKEGKEMGQILKDFFKQQAYGQIQQTLGHARELEGHYTSGLEERKRIIEKLDLLKKEKALMSPEDWDLHHKKRIPTDRYGMTEPKVVDDIEMLQDQLNENQRRILYGRETAVGGRKQAKELLRRINNSQPIEEYGLNKSKQSIAELGIYAMEKTEAAKRSRPADNIDPITITLENIYPEMGYGSHPQELKDLVFKGRDQMAKELVEKFNYSKDDAKKLAETHIKATFDTGHMHMWRKHFVAKAGESKEDTDERYKKWYVEQVEDLAKSGVIGNVHLADNFGYDDAHLAPGLGSVPIKEVLDILKKHGYDKKMVVEGGFNQGKVGFYEAWKMTGSSVYAQRGTDAWLTPGSRFYNVRDGYLGVPNKPNFIFKGYAPDSEDWRPWSGTGME